MTKDVGTLKEIGAPIYEWRIVPRVKQLPELGPENVTGDMSNCHVRCRCALPKGPVRTVTRKEIMPGVYGAISVLKSNGWWFAFTNEAEGDSVSHTNLDRADLTAAIATLTEIRDAMEEQV